MKKSVKVLNLILSILLLFPIASCQSKGEINNNQESSSIEESVSNNDSSSDSNSEDSNSSQDTSSLEDPPEETKDVAENLFGMDDILVKNTSYETLYPEIEEKIELMQEQGVKSHRLRVNIGYKQEMRALLLINSSGELEVNTPLMNFYGKVITKLKECQINSIVVSAHYFYIYDGDKYFVETDSSYYDNGWNYVPSSKNSIYQDFLNGITNQFEMITNALPGVTDIEMGNELNFGFMHVDGNYNTSEKEVASVVGDISYYASKGIKKANPEVNTVLTGLAPARSIDNGDGTFLKDSGSWQCVSDFLKQLYIYIQSGNAPYGVQKSTVTNDYFEILNWHPYFSSYNYTLVKQSEKFAQNWINNNNWIYNTAKKYGDENKPVYMTEFGIVHTSASTEEDLIISQTYAEVFKKALDTDYIKIIHVFILSDYGAEGTWESGHDYNMTIKVNGHYVANERFKYLKLLFKGE